MKSIDVKFVQFTNDVDVRFFRFLKDEKSNSFFRSKNFQNENETTEKTLPVDEFLLPPHHYYQDSMANPLQLTYLQRGHKFDATVQKVS